MDDKQKLATLEWAIECLRSYRALPGTPENGHYDTFKHMAAEIRAREPERINTVLRAMTDAVDAAKRSRSRIGGYLEIGHMQHISEGLLGRWWPTVKMALEKLSTEEKRGEDRIG